MSFSIVVGNVGTVLETDVSETAWERFRKERTRSRYEEGARSFLESVTLLEGGEEVCSWTPPLGEDGESAERLWSGEYGVDAQPTLADFLEGRLEGDLYEVARSEWEDSEAYEEGGSLGFSDLESVPSAWDLSEAIAEDRLLVYVPPVCSGSDYGGGALARSNVRALEELADADGIVHWTLSGGHGSHGIAFPLWERSWVLLDALEGLGDYPVVDEDILSTVEQEDESEAWDSWIRADYARALEAETGVDVSDVPEDDIFAFFRDECDRTSTYVEHGEETYIDLEELADGVERADLLSLPGAVSTTAEEEERARAILSSMLKGAERVGAGVLSSSYGGDRLPVLEELARTGKELLGLRVLDLEEEPGVSIVGMLRQVADWPKSVPLEEDCSRVPLLGRIAHLEEMIETVRSSARACVLPVLEEESGRPYGREGRAEAWGRNPESGLPVLEHYRREVDAEWTAYVRGRDRKAKRRTVLLPRTVEDSLEDACAQGVAVSYLVRAHVLDMIAQECTRRMGDGMGTGVLTGSAGGWSTVLEVDRVGERVRVQDRREGMEPEWRPLLEWESMVRVY